jgi:hypothetical protein
MRTTRIGVSLLLILVCSLLYGELRVATLSAQRDVYFKIERLNSTIKCQFQVIHTDTATVFRDINDGRTKLIMYND